MIVIVDANILLRLADVIAPLHVVTLGSVKALTAAGDSLRALPQTIFEFWVAATRPLANNGLGLTVVECRRELANQLVAFQLLDEPPGLAVEWLDLVTAHDCKVKVAHDARYVAAMKLLGITRILTFNGADFARFPGIVVPDPIAVAAAAATP